MYVKSINNLGVAGFCWVFLCPQRFLPKNVMFLCARSDFCLKTLLFFCVRSFFFPKNVEFLQSDDKSNWTTLGTVENNLKLNPRSKVNDIQTFSIDVENIKA